MPNDSSSSCVKVRRVRGDLVAQEHDRVAIEEPLEIQIGLERRSMRSVRSVSVTMRTPGNDDELATGFLFGERILNRRSDIAGIEFPDQQEDGPQNTVRIHLKAGVSVDFKQLERHFYTTSSCGICGKASLEAVRRMAYKVSFLQLTLYAFRRQSFMDCPRGSDAFSKSLSIPADSMQRLCSTRLGISARCGKMSAATMP